MNFLTAWFPLFLAVAGATTPPPHPENYERVLIPVFYFGPGAAGSQWSTRVAAINGGDRPAVVFRPAFEGSPLCDGNVCGCGVSAVLNPGDEKYVCRSLADPFGTVFFLSKNESASVQFQSWIIEVSRLLDRGAGRTRERPSNDNVVPSESSG